MGFWWYWYGMKREVPVAGYFVDCMTTYWCKAVIEVDGLKYHQDVIADWEREQHIMAKGYSVYRVPAKDIFTRPKYVRREVLRFLRRVRRSA